MSGSGGRSRRASGSRLAVTTSRSRPRSTGSNAELLRLRVEPRDLHQVVDERPEPSDVADQQLAGAPGPGRQRVEVVSQDRRFRDEGGQRRPKLMRDIGDEPPVPRLGLLQPADRVLESGGHPVEPLRPHPELVVGGHGHPRREVAALDPFGGPRGSLDGRQHAAGDPSCGDERDEGKDERAATEPESQQAEGGLEPAHVLDEVEPGVAAGQHAADDELGLTRRASSTGSAISFRSDRGDELRRQEAGERRLDVTEVGDEVDVPAQERLRQAARVERRTRGFGKRRRDPDGQVEAGLRHGIVLDPVVQRDVDEDVRADAEHGCRQDDEGDDRRESGGPARRATSVGRPQRTAL